MQKVPSVPSVLPTLNIFFCLMTEAFTKCFSLPTRWERLMQNFVKSLQDRRSSRYISVSHILQSCFGISVIGLSLQRSWFHRNDLCQNSTYLNSMAHWTTTQLLAWQLIVSQPYSIISWKNNFNSTSSIFLLGLHPAESAWKLATRQPFPSCLLQVFKKYDIKDFHSLAL